MYFKYIKYNIQSARLRQNEATVERNSISHNMSRSEPVFTAKTTGWARDFPVRQGKFSHKIIVLISRKFYAAWRE